MTHMALASHFFAMCRFLMVDGSRALIAFSPVCLHGQHDNMENEFVSRLRLENCQNHGISRVLINQISCLPSSFIPVCGFQVFIFINSSLLIIKLMLHRSPTEDGCRVTLPSIDSLGLFI
jgi:hypothetical protein